jgi:GNAT superfamily N-acetyltransferase
MLPSSRLTQPARLVRPDEVDAYAGLFARCFAQEPWSATLLDVLDSPASRDAYLRAACLNDIREFARYACAFVLDDLAGLVLCSAREAISQEEYARIGEESFEAGCAGLTERECALLGERRASLFDVTDDSWCRTNYPDGYAFILAVAVSPHYRGTNAFDLLFDPLIERCGREGLPLCLEAYANKLVTHYGKKGFAVLQQDTHAATGLTRSCMVWRPTTSTPLAKLPLDKILLNI